MKSVLIIDNDWNRWESYYRTSPDLAGCRIQAFTHVQAAAAFLDRLPASELPDYCIIDGYDDFSHEVGDRDATIIADYYDQSGFYNKPLFLFKSIDDSTATMFQKRFRASHPEFLSNLFLVGTDPNTGNQCFKIAMHSYAPPSRPTLVADFISAGNNHGSSDELAGKLVQMYKCWDDLDTVVATEKDTSDACHFSFGAGRPCAGRLITDLEDLSSFEKRIYLCDDFESGILQYAGNLSAILVSNHSTIPMHILFLLEPYNVSLLIGFEGRHGLDSLSDLEGLFCTLDPKNKLLYPKNLEILSLEQSMRPVSRIVKDFERDIGNRVSSLDHDLPVFSVNVTNFRDIERAPEGMPVGLTRTEHFFSPYCLEPEEWALTRDYLIGDLSNMRTNFDMASYQAGAFTPPLWMNGFVSRYDAKDVIRFPDIPAEEFFSGPDLERFNELYGVGTRGVQLARQLPDLYPLFLKCLMSVGNYEAGSFPSLLIPAVQSRDDIDFVKSCVCDTLPADIYSHVRLGSMIETIEAWDDIEAIAASVEYISIGTNDLTAALYHVSRQDHSQTWRFYEMQPLTKDAIADIVSRARAVKPDIFISICGHAATDLSALRHFHEEGFRIDSFSVPSSFRHTQLLPLLYAHMVLQSAERSAPAVAPQTYMTINIS